MIYIWFKSDSNMIEIYLNKIEIGFTYDLNKI